MKHRIILGLYILGIISSIVNIIFSVYKNDLAGFITSLFLIFFLGYYYLKEKN